MYGELRLIIFHLIFFSKISFSRCQYQNVPAIQSGMMQTPPPQGASAQAAQHQQQNPPQWGQPAFQPSNANNQNSPIDRTGSLQNVQGQQANPLLPFDSSRIMQALTPVSGLLPPVQGNGLPLLNGLPSIPGLDQGQGQTQTQKFLDTIEQSICNFVHLIMNPTKEASGLFPLP